MAREKRTSKGQLATVRSELELPEPRGAAAKAGEEGFKEALEFICETSRRMSEFADRMAWGEEDDSGLLAWITHLNHPELIADVVRDGADIGKDGPAALEACAWFGHAAAATVLLRAGADPNGREGRPLIISANRGHGGVAQLLLGRGANAGVADQRLAGSSPTRRCSNW